MTKRITSHYKSGKPSGAPSGPQSPLAALVSAEAVRIAGNRKKKPAGGAGGSRSVSASMRLAPVSEALKRLSEQRGAAREAWARQHPAAAAEQAALEARRAELAALKAELRGSRLQAGPVEQLVGRVVDLESEGGSHRRIRRRTVLADRRVRLPDDLRAAGLEFVRLHSDAELLGRINSVDIEGEARGPADDHLIADPVRARIVGAARLVEAIEWRLRGTPSDVPPLTAWDWLHIVALQGYDFGAIAGDGRGKRRRYDEARGAFVASLRALQPML